MNRELTFELNATRFELIENLRRFLKFCQWLKLLANVSPIKLPSLTDNYPFDIYPILSTPGEGFQHDQVFGGTCSQRNVGWVNEVRGTLDHQGFVGQCGECDVETNSFCRAKQ